MQALQSSPPDSRPDAAIELFGLTPERLELLKRTIAKGCTDDEFALFVEVCKRRKIDPFSKLLYPVKRWDSKVRAEVMALQSSIDSFRLVAGRNPKYAGQRGPQWCGAEGQWVDVWLKKEPPAAARVGILRHDFLEPLWTVALWESYCQRTKEGAPMSFWAKMGPLMLAKCAEALGLRRAFPEDLAGLYVPEEMDQATNAEAPREVQAEPKAVPAALPAAKPTTLDALVQPPAHGDGGQAWRETQVVQQPDGSTDIRGANAPPAQAPADSASPAERAEPAGQPQETLNKETGELVPKNLWWPSDDRELETAFPVDCGFWDDWCDQEIPDASKLHNLLKSKGLRPTWREAANGTKSGGRHSLLLFHVQQGLKGLSEGTKLSTAHKRAACALAMLLAHSASDPSSEKEQGVLQFG